MILSNYAIKFRTAVFVSVVVLVIAGAVSYMRLPREAMPDITIPHVFVTAVYEGTAPTEIEKLITIPLEKQLNDVEGVKHIKSVSAESYCSIDIECLAGEDIDEARQRVRDKVDLARPDLPDDLDEPVVQAFNVSSDVPIFIVALSGSTELSRLKHLAEALQDRIELLPGVRQALVSGTREREIRVEIDLQRLIAYDIPIELVMDRVARENSTVSAGNLEMDGDKFQVRIPGEFKLVPDIRNILLTQRDDKPIYLRDVASVLDTYKDRETISRLNGATSVSLSIKKRTGENSVALIERVRAELEAFPMPPGIDVTFVYDESEYVDMMISELENNIASGFLLVIVVLFIFMGGRNSLFVAVAIPLSMLVAFAVMSLLDFSLNMMVLFSLVLAVGMLVDNAIVIVENIFRNHALGLDRVAAARKGAAEVAWPVITSTVTTCAAFAPLLFWPDLMGQFMSFMPRTLIIVLCASLFVAIVINPAICSALISRGHGRLREDSSEAKGAHPFVAAYERLLRGALKHRGAVTLLSLLFLVLSIQLYGVWGLGVELFPEVEPRNAVVKVSFPQGTSIERTDAVLRDIETTLTQYEDVEFFLTTVGQVGGFTFTAGAGGGSHVGNIHVEFRDMKDRTGNTLALVDTIRKAVGTLPGVEVRVEREEEGPPTGDPISIEVAGDDFEVLASLSAEIIRAVETVPGLVDLQDNLEDALPELQFIVDRHRAALLGLDTDTIGLFLRTSIYGVESSRFRADEDEYDITLRLPAAQRDSATLLDQVRIPLPDGRTVPLSSVGELVYAGGRGSINRTDRKRVITISGSNQDRGVDKIMADVMARVAALDLPSGYGVRYAGDTEEMMKAFAFLGRAFAVAAGLILVVLVIQFNSVLLPGIIFLSVLLSIIGVMWGLMVCRMKFGAIMTGVGVISLAGIVVNNAIVLMDCILQRRAEGVSAVESVVQAGRMRLRPVLLTAVTTVLGLIPMAIGWSLEIHTFPPRIIAGTETSAWWAPMAVAVIFGLTLATALTLVLIPVLYSLVESLVAHLRGWLHMADDGHTTQKF
ncbi:MAG: efflux RND transporter permease subunit [Verrucomicrobia bacterium]|nr:efflux RND transporter permease subunit [Verrucomicrobiota bacterium]MBT7067547.1 efflux RND transporter permease subunit [Verrucomicrobiota bacterium]MBT7698704.1 efflux RND transporter permease subunit [Verrucomicrobiota bacterium]